MGLSVHTRIRHQRMSTSSCLSPPQGLFSCSRLQQQKYAESCCTFLFLEFRTTDCKTSIPKDCMGKLFSGYSRMLPSPSQGTINMKGITDNGNIRSEEKCMQQALRKVARPSAGGETSKEWRCQLGGEGEEDWVPSPNNMLGKCYAFW